MNRFNLELRLLWLGWAVAAGCSGAPEAPSPDAAVQPSPTAAPEALVIPLQPTSHCDGGMGRPWTRDNFTTAHRHPNADAIEAYFGPRIGEGILMVGIEQDGQGWNVSADIDEDGAIQDSERFTLVRQPPSPDGQTHVVEIRYPYPTAEVPDYHLDITLTLEEGPDALVTYTCVESGRSGEIPVAGGVPIFVKGVGGDFSQPGSTLMLDGDRDGSPDTEDFLNHYTVGEGLVQLPDGHIYAFAIDAAGTVLRLQPSDKALTGLHFLAPAPHFEGQATDGKTHQLSDYAGDVLLLDFWATWCAPCIALHPEVEEFAVAKNLTVLGISADDNNEKVKRWLKKNPTPWPSIAQGPAGAINLAYSVDGWPTHVLIDPQGRLVAYGKWETIKDAVNQRIWEPTAKTTPSSEGE